MNTKVKELISQVKTDTSGKWVQTENLENLAILIVNECRNALRPELRDMISRGSAYDSIKEHFGVE
jgi:hypothetical protein